MNREKILTAECRSKKHARCPPPDYNTGGVVQIGGKWVPCDCPCHAPMFAKLPAKRTTPPRHGELRERYVVVENGNEPLWRETAEGVVLVRPRERRDLLEVRWCSTCQTWRKIEGEFEHALGLCPKCLVPIVRPKS